MKKILFLFLCFFVLFSCKKENVRKSFTGKWEYVTFVGYPFNFPSYPPGNGIIIEIGKNGSFKRYTHDTLIFKGLYNLIQKKDCQGSQKLSFFKTNDPSFANDDSIEIQGDSLFFSTASCYADGGSAIYRKISF